METNRQSIARKVKEYIKIKVFEEGIDCVLSPDLKKEAGVLEKI